MIRFLQRLVLTLQLLAGAVRYYFSKKFGGK